MYNIEYPYDQEMDVWAKCELERMANNLRVVEAFWLYVKSKWLPKTTMWVVGNHNLPYIRQDTNATIENYHMPIWK